MDFTEVRKEIQECTGHVAQAEQRISDVEDNVNGLISRVSGLENTVTALSNKVKDLKCRNRQNNVRLVGLPEKAEGLDTVAFLEKWKGENMAMSHIYKGRSTHNAWPTILFDISLILSTLQLRPLILVIGYVPDCSNAINPLMVLFTNVA